MAIIKVNIMKNRIILSVLIIACCLCKAGAMPKDTVLTSNAVTVDASRLDSQAGNDLRSRMIGMIPGLEVVEHTGQTMRGTTNIGQPWLSSGHITFASKGWSVMSCFVDGVAVPFSQFYLDPNQIETISFVSDVNDKAGVNPLASQGALMITTRQGHYNTPMKVDVSVESGVGFVDKMPGYVDGEWYARMNNYARGSAGYIPLYSEQAIREFARKDMFSTYYPNVDYKDLLLREYKPMTRFGISIGGGSANVKYHFAANGLNDGDLFKVGPTADYNKINMTSSVSAKIGRWIEARASFMGLVSIERGNNAGINAYKLAPAVAFPIAFGRSLGTSNLEGDNAGTMVYAVSRTFTKNPYAEVVDGGFFTSKSRSGMFNAEINVDLGFILSGLKTRSHVNFGSYYYQKAGKKNDYLAYFWDADEGIVDLSAHLGTKQSKKSVSEGLSYQNLNFTQDLWYELRQGKHSANAKASFNLLNSSRSGNNYNERLLTALATFDYSYDSRYAAAFTVQTAGASPYAPGRRWAAFPTGSLTWIASNEEFLKDVSWIDYLKVYAQAGMVGGADVFSSNYLYQANYDISDKVYFGPATANQWFGSDKENVPATAIKRHANPELTWPKITEVDAGVDFSFYGINLGLKGFWINRTGAHTNTMSRYSNAFGWNGIAFYENYNCKQTAGMEISLDYGRKIGDFSFNVGGWMTTWKTINTLLADDQYRYDWQRKTGRSESIYLGYVCIGKFETAEQIASLPKLDETGTQIGDLMYKDLNADGFIDENDKTVIGNTAPAVRYSLNIDLQYKNFGLSLTGTGRAGYDLAMTNDYFWSGWGDGVYSDFILENLGGAYPRLSYEKSSTNFVPSDFWLRNGGYFKLKSAELSYTLEPSVKWVQKVKFSVTGGNLFTLTGVKYVDPEDIDAGVSAYPFFRTVMAGIKVTF